MEGMPHFGGSFRNEKTAGGGISREKQECCLARGEMWKHQEIQVETIN